MKLSNVKVEQVNLVGRIVEDYGEILSKQELNQILVENFKCEIKSDGFAYGENKGKKYCLCCKNVSYLGIPHPNFKKRIQIPSSFVEKYYENKRRDIETFFIGIYKYQENIIFVNFDTKKYILNKAHNSSAHVLVIDLVNTIRRASYYLKKDARENEIFCFINNKIQRFFDMYLHNTIDLTPRMFKVFNQFFDDLNPTWYGIDCYKEMIQQDYHRKFQPEWPGAYLEYKFENFVTEHQDVKSVVRYSPVRGSEGAIDLDLYFPLFDEYGDLKAHTNTSPSIIGNKTSTVKKCIEGKKSIYYVVFNHDTTPDKECNFIVTEFWNSSQHKDNLRSYANKMKNKIELTSYMILEINEDNFHYLNSDFQKGFLNSDGNTRSGKISISNKVLPNFIIHEYKSK